jgi:hypothetical protein
MFAVPRAAKRADKPDLPDDAEVFPVIPQGGAGCAESPEGVASLVDDGPADDLDFLDYGDRL